MSQYEQIQGSLARVWGRMSAMALVTIREVQAAMYNLGKDREEIVKALLDMIDIIDSLVEEIVRDPFDTDLISSFLDQLFKRPIFEAKPDSWFDDLLHTVPAALIRIGLETASIHWQTLRGVGCSPEDADEINKVLLRRWYKSTTDPLRKIAKRPPDNELLQVVRQSAIWYPVWSRMLRDKKEAFNLTTVAIANNGCPRFN